MVLACDPHGDGQLGVVVAHHNLARAEQIKLQTAAQACLVDVGQQCRHFCLARQLLLKLQHVLLDLLALLLQGIEIDSFDQMLLILNLQGHFFGLSDLQLVLIVG